jgi:tetratricopeptide (TPR) repeat protein
MPYRLNAAGEPDDAASFTAALSKRLNEARKARADSPVYQAVDGFPDVQRLKTDVFRDRVQYSSQIKEQLAKARKEGAAAVREVEARLGNIGDSEAGVVIDLFLSYRAVKAWDAMVDLVSRMAAPLAATVMVREQLGLALNRAGRGDEAERVLTTLIEERGPSSETYGILGRVYKDRWEAAQKAGDTFLARGLLDKAIGAYVRGFETDWRDAYPGVNAVTLMEVKEPPDPRRVTLIPVVRYAVERRVAAGRPDYWDHATLLELAILAKDEARAAAALSDALASVREPWEPETTARNLRLIGDARERRRESVAWANEVEQALMHRSTRTS